MEDKAFEQHVSEIRKVAKALADSLRDAIAVARGRLNIGRQIGGMAAIFYAPGCNPSCGLARFEQSFCRRARIRAARRGRG